MEVKAALMGEDYEKLKNWQREAYHKQMIGGFKETKEADDGFRKAQKPWAKKLKEVCFKVCCFLLVTNQLLQNEALHTDGDTAFALHNALPSSHTCVQVKASEGAFACPGCASFPLAVSEGGE